MLREETEVFLSLLKDAETGQRGFVITGDRHYLAPYDAAQASVGRQLERLGGLTGEMPDQHARVGGDDGSSSATSTRSPRSASRSPPLPSDTDSVSVPTS